MNTSNLIAGLIAAIIGFVVGWFISKFRTKGEVALMKLQNQLLQAAKDDLDSKLQLLRNESDEARGQAAILNGRIDGLNNSLRRLQVLEDLLPCKEKEIGVLTANMNNLRHALALQEKQQLEREEEANHRFKAMAQEILDNNAAKFTQVNKENMAGILDPLKKELGDFKKKVEDTYEKESKERFSLEKAVESLLNTTLKVSEEANNLTVALKGNKKQQGNWGEMLLESILEHSGLTKNREYFLQEFIKDAAGNIIKDEHGKGLQPDVTIRYPDDRRVIIDSKVSLVAWDRFVAVSDPPEQRQAMQEHLQSIYNHVNGLSRKNYPKHAQALDYVIMFVPIEVAFLEAMKEDVQLWKYAYDKRILMVSPTNLLAVIKIIADLWRIEQQSQNAIAIAEKAGDLYDKFVGFTDTLQDVGMKIGDVQSSYDTAFQQLSSGKGNLIRRVEELKKMGASAKK